VSLQGIAASSVASFEPMAERDFIAATKERIALLPRLVAAVG
jgi:hypothetical protein